MRRTNTVVLGGGTAGSSSGITIGTTTITSGTDTRVLFDDGGKVGESAGLTYVKGTGTLSATVLSGGTVKDTGLTASRLVVSDASQNLASNGALTTNAIPKAVSSGASLADSSFINSAAGEIDGPAGTTFAAKAIASAQGASSIAGTAFTINASDAVAGSANNGAAAGGSVTITSGAAARKVSGDANGGDINLVPGAGVGTGTQGQVLVPTGASLTRPGLGLGATDTGFWNLSSGIIGFISNHVGVARYQATQPFYFIGGPGVGFSSGDTSTTSPDVGVARQAAKVLKFTDGAATPAGAASYWGTNSKALTESSATIFVKITTVSGSASGFILDYCIEASDSVSGEFQSLSGSVPISYVNKAGAITAAVGTPTEILAVSLGGSTLTNTFTAVDATGNILDIKANAVSSLTQTTFRINYFLRQVGNIAFTAVPQ